MHVLLTRNNHDLSLRFVFVCVCVSVYERQLLRKAFLVVCSNFFESIGQVATP